MSPGVPHVYKTQFNHIYTGSFNQCEIMPTERTRKNITYKECVCVRCVKVSVNDCKKQCSTTKSPSQEIHAFAFVHTEQRTCNARITVS